MLAPHLYAAVRHAAVGRAAAVTVISFVPAHAAARGASFGHSTLRGGALSATPGLDAAILSPAASALGFMLWDKNWLGSAFALNFAKNVIASVFYFITLSATGAVPSFSPGDASTVAFPFLALSAFLGVVIGDCTAIASLQRLGARRYLLIDCLKPALAQLLGVVFFSEKVTYRLAAGIAAVISGVYIASASKVPAVTADMAPDVSTKNSKRLALGYALAVGHLIFDTAGVSITKAHSNGLGPLSIGLLRFGSAALMLGTIGAVAQGWASAVRSRPTFAAPSASKGRGVVEGSWWQLPANMSASNWKNIVFGTFFVTFIGPALFMRSVLLMPLGLAVTLSCTAPLYEPLLARVLRGVRAELQAVLGAALACVGVAILCV